MSILSLGFAPRRHTAEAAVDTAVSVVEAAPALVGTLADMRAGQVASVVSVETSDDPAAARRLFDLGFVPGAEVLMVRKAPLADPVVFRVAGYEIALRRAQARWVNVSAPGA